MNSSVIASHKGRVDGQACKAHDKVYAEQSPFLFTFQYLAAFEDMPPTKLVEESYGPHARCVFLRKSTVGN